MSDFGKLGLQVFDLTGLTCTSFKDWLGTPYVFRAWRPGM